MAEQVPYGVATSLINTLVSFASTEIASIYGVDTEIEWLKETVEDIKAVLADADQKQQTGKSIQRWISKLKKVLYEADDLLDEIHTQHLLRDRDGRGKGMGKVRHFFSCSNPVAFRHKIAGEIRNIRKQFNGIAEDMSKLNLDRRVVEMKHEKSKRPETYPLPQEGIVGREENKKDIVDLLLNNHNNNSDRSVSLVAIVGIGGLGKTALANLVYHDADVERFFHKRIWVCVSDDFDVKALVKRILELLLGKKEDDQQLQLLQNKLQRNLYGQKFLLVLDDIWDDFPEKWVDLKNFLMRGIEGSKILLTTRNQAVASQMGVKTPYRLKGLNNDQSWTLLKRLAFDNDKEMTQNLKFVGQKIAEKCAGVPLAIRVMGSLLQSKSQESEWEAILEDDFWELHQGNESISIMPILKLSYDSLAIELKQCFAYCSLYPKDWEYEKDELIDLWMAQGFLENKGKKQCPEKVGEDYIHILYMKSFLQDVQTGELGEMKYFKMHDLMHDLSQSIAGSDYCLYNERRENVERRPIHASFEQCNFDSSRHLLDPSRLRTFHEIKKKYERNPSNNVFVFRRLRSLDLSCYEMICLPKSIGKMSHLRYLNLADCDKLTCLPKSISNLVNLQVLRLNGCYNLKFSVDIITKFINLHRLEIGNCKAFEGGMPVGLGRMTTLQHLSDFIVGKDDKERKNAKLNELKELNLRGSLTIEKLGFVRDVEEKSKDVNLTTKKNLISLTLDWGYSIEMNSDAKQLLENLRPHQNLKALDIRNYPGACLSDWFLSCTNFVELSFFGIMNFQYLPALEGLVSLKSLHIKLMYKLEYICYNGCSSSTTFFPSLEELMIRDCSSLRGWIEEANVQNTRGNEWHHSLPPFSRLSLLEIDCCPKLSCMPTFPNLVRRLALTNCSTMPLLDTLNVSTIGSSKSDDMAASLSMLKSLEIRQEDIEALPEEWMQNLSSLKLLSIMHFSSLEKLFRQMQNLRATLEEFRIFNLDLRNGDEDYNIQCQDLRCLLSLKKIEFLFCEDLMALPKWICDLQSLQIIVSVGCKNLESFPEGMCRLTNLLSLEVLGSSLLKERCKRETGVEWPKIAHIPTIWIDDR